MNRRQLFAGAGATAVASVLPTPALPAEQSDDIVGNTSIWFVVWADGRHETRYGNGDVLFAS